MDQSERLENLMIDDTLYGKATAFFKMFQLLRICDAMVQETLEDFECWHNNIKTTFAGNLALKGLAFKRRHVENFENIWERHGDLIKREIQRVQSRVKEQRDDVQSLSDNVSVGF